MDGVNTMDLSGGMSDMTPVFSFDTPPPEKTNTGQKHYEMPPPINEPEKNIRKNKMDSTPIGDIMGPAGGNEGPEPRFMMEQQPMFVQQAPSVKKNPFNLTDEQLEALIAGVAAVVAFSSTVQDKLSTTVPQFLAASGERSNVGLIVTALLAAVIFYFAKKFAIKE